MCKLSSVTYISTTISNWRFKWLLTYFTALVSFYAPWKQKEISIFLMYFRECRKRPTVPWNIFLTTTLVECWYSCLFHNKACFLIVDCFFQYTQEVYSFNVVWFKLISVTASSRCSWQPIEALNFLVWHTF